MRPSYFDPASEPDTETQYRRGGKVKSMNPKKPAKKMPRKFADGGVTEGLNKNIDDDTRARAIALSNMRMEAAEGRGPSAKSSKTAPKAAPKAPRAPLDTGDETDRLAGRGAKSTGRGVSNADDRSIPAAESTYEPYKPSRMERISKFASDAGREALRNVDALGPMALAGAIGAKAVRGGMQATRQAEGVMAKGAERAAKARETAQAEGVMAKGAARAAETRDRMSALREGRERAQEAVKARETAKETAQTSRRVPKDVEEEAFAAEGNPNFKKGGKVKKYATGGAVKGWGVARGARKARMC